MEHTAVTHFFEMCLENIFEKQSVIFLFRALSKMVYSEETYMVPNVIKKKFKIIFLNKYIFVTEFIFLKCSETCIYENL